MLHCQTICSHAGVYNPHIIPARGAEHGVPGQERPERGLMGRKLTWESHTALLWPVGT